MPRPIFKASDFQPDIGIPWIPVFTEEKLRSMTVEQIKKYMEARAYAERRSIENPVGAGWTLPSWRLVMKNWKKYNLHILLGGNQAAKTTFGARMAVWASATIPEAAVYCWHVSERRSIDDQQRFIYEALPDTIKAIPTKKGIAHNLQYGQKNGFTDHIMILPPHPGYNRGGSINFFNYSQYQQNDQMIEGMKAHFVWADEKIPLGLLETLRSRLITYHGRMLLTYTVIDGWNDTVEKILAKTKTLIKRKSERLGIELPIMQESLSLDSCAIYYAWTDDNPFTSPDEFWKLYATADRATILARAFGVPTKAIAGAFPGFNREINVIPHAELPFVKNESYKITRFMGIDPGGSKHWAMLWVAIDPSDTWWVYDEWPNQAVGDWALPGNKPGPAQRGTSKGIRDYVDLIRHVEEGHEPYERIIDPRLGASEKQTLEGATTIIGDLDEAGMPVIPAPGGGSGGLGEIEDGLQLINNLLAYDEKKTRDSVNTPRLFVSDRCQNFIYCMSEYTGKLGPSEVTKDFVDVLRYLRKANCEYIDMVADKKVQNSTGVY